MPEDKKYKLWESLNSSGYYTKSYDEFNTQFSTPESQQKLYGALSSNGYYTKTQEDFSTQFFGNAEVKKKSSPESSTGVGVGVEQSGSGSEVQSASTEKKIEPITQVGEEFQTVSEVESGKKEPQNEYLRNGATYTKEEYDTLNQSSQDITAKKQAYDETIKEFQKSGTIPSELIAFRKKEYEDAVAQQEKLVIQKTFPDDEKFANFYDLNTMQPMSVPAKDYQSFVTDFYDKNLKERFDGKSIDDLSWDEQRVLNYQFGINYLKKKDLQSYLDQTGGDVNLGDVPHAWNQFGQAAWSGISDMINSLSISDNMATVDYLNAQFSKAYTGAISKDEYNTEIKSYGDKLRSQQAAGLPMTLPGVNPSGGYKVDPVTNQEIPLYTKEDVDKFIREIPPYEDAVLKSGTGAGLSNQLPYPQSNMFRDLANKLDKVISVVPNNPKKKDSFVLNDIPQALGSSAGFALTGFLGIPELSFLTGAMQNASSTYKQAIELGASPDEAQKAFVKGLGVGTSEGAPIELIFRGLTNKFGSGIAGVIISGIAGGTAESIQEGLQGVANREILDFIDENRKKENIGRSMGAAAVTGLLMGMASKVAADPNASEEEKKVAASLMTDLQADIKEKTPIEEQPVKEEIKQGIQEAPLEPKIEEKTTETVENKGNSESAISEEIKVEEPVVEKPEEKVVEPEVKPTLQERKEAAKKKLDEVKKEVAPVEEKLQEEPIVEKKEENVQVEPIVSKEEEKIDVTPEEVKSEPIVEIKEDKLPEITSKYGWKIEQQGKNRILKNANDKIVATIKQKGDKYTIEDNSGTTLLKGSGQIEKSVEKVMKDYFMAKERNIEQTVKKELPSFEQKHGIKIEDIQRETEEMSKFISYKPMDNALTKMGVEEHNMKEVKADYIKHVLENELPKKLPAKKARFEVDELPDVINPKPIDKKVAPLKDKTTKSKAESLKTIVSDDDLRPQMTGVFHDKENGKLVATDAHKLFVINDDSIKESGIFDPKTGNKIEGRFPNYTAVIPEDNPVKIPISISEIRPKLEGIARTNKFINNDNRGEILTKIKFGETEYLFNTEMLNEVLSVLEQHGHDKVTMELSKPNRALVINTGDITALLMPVFQSDEAIAHTVTVVDKELTDADKKMVADFEHQEKIKSAESTLGYSKRWLKENEDKVAEAEKELKKAEKHLTKLTRTTTDSDEISSAKYDIGYWEKQVERAKEYVEDYAKDVKRDEEKLNAIKNGTDEPISKISDNDAESVVKDIEGKAESNDEADLNAAIETANEVIKEKNTSKKKAAKEAVKKAKEELNNLGIADNENEKRAKLMAAYTDLAIIYVEEGIKSAVEFAKELGEELSDIIKEAWDNAVNVPDKEDGGRKKALLNRAHEGTSKEDLRAAIEKHGLNYEPESWDEAKKKARDFINEVGLESAFDAVKKGDIVGAPAAFVWAEVIDKVHNEIAESTDPAEIDRLNDLEAELLSQFDIEARRKGQFISALQEVYAKADFNYNLEARIKDYKEVNNGVIPKEVEEKMIELDKQLKDVQGKLKEAEQRAKEAEEKLAFDAIKESVDRSKGEPLSQEEIDRRVREGVESELNKAMSKLSKVRKATAKKAVAALEKLDQSLAGMYFESTLGIPVAIVRGGIKVAIAGIKLTGKVADAIESGLKHIQEEFEKQTGEKLKKSDYDRAKNLLTENLEGAGVDTSSRKDKTVREKDGKLKIPHELIRELVESGVDNITDLTAEVLKEVKKTIPDATERQVRDAITQYGRTVNLNQEEVETEIRRLKRIGRDVSKLEDIEQGKRPKRSGLQRDTLTAEERALQKQVKEGLKTLPMDVETQEKELRTSLDQIERRLENQIEDLQREIDTGEKAVKDKKVIEYNDRIKELIKERDNIKQIRDEMFADEGLTADERIDRAKKATERAINDIEKRIAEGKLEPKTQTKIESPELAELREKLAEAKAKMKGLQDIAGITEKVRLERAKQAVQKRIAELQQKIETSDFAKKVRKPLFEDSELAKLRAEKERIKEEFDKLRYQAELKNRSARQKFIDGLLEAWNLTRALRATFEFSPMLIQLGFYAVTHPIHAIRSLSYGFSHFFSKERADKFQMALEASPEYSHMKEDKLSITRPDYKQSVKEELYISQWLNTIWNFVFREGFPIKILHDFPARYERAATGMMNTMRVLRYMDGEEMLERAGITRESNPEDFKNVASMVNTFTLRTSLGKAEMASKLLSFFLFSPKAWASILKTWTPYAIYEFGRMSSKDAVTGKKKISVAQKMALADYAKFIGLTAGIVGMVATYLNNDDDDDTGVEFDPTSSDFLTMKIGNTRIDPWGGRRPMMVLQARLTLEAMNRMGVYDGHSYKKLSGETNRLGVYNETPTPMALIGQMTQNKLSPSMQIVYNAMTTYLDSQGGQERYGKPYEFSDEVLNNLYPIYIETLTELWKDQPDATAGLLTFYAFLGGGVQTYLPKEGKGGVKKIQKVQTVKPVKKVEVVNE